MADVDLRVRLDANNEKNARTVLKRLAALITFDMSELSPHHDGSYIARLKATVPEGTWPEQVVAAIDLAQTFGYGWDLDGHIAEELSMHAARFSVSGLVSASLLLSRG
ncbi:hypothetical protein [Pelagibius sp.]|uniref:hypothetical protein n=1 Tax=Pelagibius sp. TaxID=1931238 RepID=UPI003B50DE3E